MQKILNRHGLGRCRQRVDALARLTAATTGLVVDDARQGPFGFCHFAARPGDLVALDGFYIGNLKGVGKVWQLTAVDTTTRWAICHVLLGPSNTDIAQRFLDRVITKLRRLGVAVTGVLTDTVPSSAPRSTPISRPSTSPITGPRPAHRTTTRSANGSKAPPCKNAGDPAFHRRRFDRLGQLRAEIDMWLVDYNHRRPNHSDYMAGRTPPPSPRPTPQQASIMNPTNRVHLSPRPVARKD